MKNRRQFFRIRTMVPIALKIMDAGTVIHGFSRDISTHGLKIKLPHDKALSEKISEGRPVQLDIMFPFSKNKMTLTGSLIWSVIRSEEEVYPLEAGVQFVNLPKSVGVQIFMFALRKHVQPYFLLITIMAAICLLLLLKTELHTYKTLNDQLEDTSKMQSASLEKLRHKTEILQKSHVETMKQHDALKHHIASMTSQHAFLKSEIDHRAGLIESLETEKKQMSKALALLHEEMQSENAPLSEKGNAKIETLEVELKSLKEKTALILEEKWSIENQLTQITEKQKTMTQTFNALHKTAQKNLEEVFDSDVSQKIILHVSLRNGYVFTGVLVSEDDTFYELRVAQGILTIPKNEVKLKQKLNIRDYQVLESVWQAELKRYEKVSRLPVSFVSSGDASTESELAGERRTTILNHFVKGVRYDISYPKTVGGVQKLHHIPKDVIEGDFKNIAAFGFNTLFFKEEINPQILNYLEMNQLHAVIALPSPTEHTDFSSPAHASFFKEAARHYIESLGSIHVDVMFVVFDDTPWQGHFESSPVDKFGKETVFKFLQDLIYSLKKDFPKYSFAGTFQPSVTQWVFDFDGLDAIFIEAPHAIPGGYASGVKEDILKSLKTVKSAGLPVYISSIGCSTLWPGLNQGAVLKEGIEAFMQNSLHGFLIDSWADNWSRAGYKEHLDHEPVEHMGLVTGYRREKQGGQILKDYLNVLNPSIS